MTQDYNGLINTFPVYVFLRPHLYEMLDQLSKNFELLIFTASKEEYANKIVDFIEKDKKYFDYVLHREHCNVSEEHKVFTKDLNILCNNRKLSDIVIIDNRIISYLLNIKNGIPIKDYLKDPYDDELLELTKYLNT